MPLFKENEENTIKPRKLDKFQKNKNKIAHMLKFVFFLFVV